jgi:hypothetical protein
MELTRFKRLHKKFSKSPLPKNIWNTSEYEGYINAIDNDKDCGEWYLKFFTRKAGIRNKEYCCLYMAYYLIEDNKSKRRKEINYDSIVTHDKKGKAFGIPIHDGGSSFIKIDFCPWCGDKL